MNRKNMFYKKSIYIPIEIKYRELNSQLLLAAIAARFGYRTYVGDKASLAKIIKSKKNKGGIYFYKGTHPLDYTKYLSYKCDCQVILDQEMGPAAEDYQNKLPCRFYPGTQEYIDRFYVIGPKAYSSASKTLENLKGKVIMTGWPRVDLWRNKLKDHYQETADRYRQQYGPFILYASDFGFTSQKRIDRIYSQYFESEIPELRASAGVRKANAEQNFVEFKNFINLLSKWDKDPEIPQIVIRPHPAEDIDAWREAISGLRKVICIYEGDIGEWIYASLGVLHRGCTSGVQSYISGVPVAYYVLSKDRIRDALSYQLSDKLHDTEELKRWIRTICDRDMQGESYNNLKNEELQSVVYITDKLASELVVENLNTLDVKPEPPWVKSLSHYRPMIFGFAKGFIRRISINYRSHFKQSRIVSSQKMPGGISEAEVNMFLKNLPFKNEIVVNKVMNNCFVIEAQEKG